MGGRNESLHTYMCNHKIRDFKHVSLNYQGVIGKIFSSDNKVSVNIMYFYINWLVHQHFSQDRKELTSPNMYECFVNTKYLCTYLNNIESMTFCLFCTRAVDKIGCRTIRIGHSTKKTTHEAVTAGKICRKYLERNAHL